MIRKSKLFGLAAVIAAIVLIAIISVGVTSCSGPEGPEGPQGPKGESGLDGGDGADGSGTPSLITTYTVTYDSSNGSPVEPETVIKNGKAKVPVNPTRDFTIQQITAGGPGLYVAGDGGWIFDGWFLGDELYSFDTPITNNITLKAGWTLPSKVSEDADGINAAPVDADFFAKALAYVIATPQTYILAIERNYTLTATVSVSNKAAYLTVIGLGAERRITADSSNGQLTTINNGGTLTLGNNITVVGKPTGATTSLFSITNGTLIMEAGSKITGHQNTAAHGNTITAGAATAHFIMNGGEISGCTNSSNTDCRGIVVLFTGGKFTMNGGEIKNNQNISTASFIAGAVSVSSQSTFTMNGGVITGNRAEVTNGQSAGGVVVVVTNTVIPSNFIMNGGTITGNFGNHGDVLKTFSNGCASNNARPMLYLDKDAEIGVLTSADNTSTPSIVYTSPPAYIHEGWIGKIEILYLRGDYNNITGVSSSVIWRWLNAKVVEGSPQNVLTNAHIANIKNVYFINNVNGSTPQDISTAGTGNGYQISTSADPTIKGTLVVK
jgi:hypothetical protein